MSDVTVVEDGSTIIVTVSEATVSVGDPAIVSASYVPNTPAGSISATTVQAALNELDAEKQPLAANLTALSALVGAADTVAYFVGAGAMALTSLTAYGRSLIATANAGAARTALGLAALAASASAGDITAGLLAPARGGTGADLSGATAGRLCEFGAAGVIGQANIADGFTGGIGTFGGTLTGARTYTFPDQAGTVPLLERAQTWSAIQSFIGSTNGSFRTVVQNTNAGNAAVTETRIENDLGSACRLSLASYASGYSGTVFGVSLPNATGMIAIGASVSSILIGSFSTAAPIVFGVNGNEVARITSTGFTANGTMTSGATVTGSVSITRAETTGAPTFQTLTNSTGDVLRVNYTETATGSIPADVWQIRLGGNSARPVCFTNFDTSIALRIDPAGTITTGGALTVASTVDVTGTGASVVRVDTTAAGAANPAFVIRSGGTTYWQMGIEGGTGSKAWFLYNNTGADNAIRVADGAGGTISMAREVRGVNTASGGYAFLGVATNTLGASIGDGYLSGFASAPTYNGAFTVTRHNYIQLNNPAGTGTVTDACVFVFNAAIGTHKAVDSGTTKTSPGTVTAWVKVNINGTVHYMPAYASKNT